MEWHFTACLNVLVIDFYSGPAFFTIGEAFSQDNVLTTEMTGPGKLVSKLVSMLPET